MDLNKIQKIVNSHTSEDAKKHLILKTIAEDKKAIPMLLEMFNSERHFNNELINDLNLELSRTHIYIEELDKNKRIKQSKNKTKGLLFDTKFVLEKVEEFYTKYSKSIKHCFNRFPKT